MVTDPLDADPDPQHCMGLKEYYTKLSSYIIFQADLKIISLSLIISVCFLTKDPSFLRRWTTRKPCCILSPSY
jgi:hypothetical protein